MLKAHATRAGGGDFFLIGITAASVTRLVQGKPIVVDLEDINGHGRVCITFGETERHIYDTLVESGVQFPASFAAMNARAAAAGDDDTGDAG